MEFDLQNAIVLCIVSVAAVYVAFRVRKAVKGKSSCGGCGGGCSSKSADPKQPALVQLTPMRSVSSGGPDQRTN